MIMPLHGERAFLINYQITAISPPKKVCILSFLLFLREGYLWLSILISNHKKIVSISRKSCLDEEYS
jgi:hypothetical protein